MVGINIENCSFAGEGEFVEDEPDYDGGSGSGNGDGGGDGDGDGGDTGGGDGGDDGGDDDGGSDNNAPTITLVGPALVNIEQGTTYIDTGATAFDPEDGDITSTIVVTGEVDVFSVGTYTLSFNVTDSLGLQAETKTRTVVVGELQNDDPAAPSWGVDPEVVICDTSVGSPAGAANSVVLNVPHIPVAETDTRTVIVNSSDNPISEVNGVFAGELLNTPGAPTGFSAKLTGLGDHTFSDIYQTVYQPTLEITFPTDQTAKDFYQQYPGLLDSLSVTFSMEIVYSLDFLNDGDDIYEEWDRLETSLTIPISIIDVVEPPDAALPTIDYGDEVVTVKYNVPLSEEELTDVVVPQSWNFGDYFLDSLDVLLPIELVDAGFGQDQDTGGIVILSPTQGVITAISTPISNLPEQTPEGNPFTVGVQLSFSIQPPFVGEETLDILVDVPLNLERRPDPDEAPLITLVGSPAVSIDEGTPYVEEGATAFDPEDGDITSDILITGAVNSEVAGTYVLYYNVTDSAGNQAVEVTRTVTVDEVDDGGGDPPQLEPPVFEYDNSVPVILQYELVGAFQNQTATATDVFPTTWDHKGNTVVIHTIEYLNLKKQFFKGFGSIGDYYPPNPWPGDGTTDVIDFYGADNTGSPLNGRIQLEPFIYSINGSQQPPANTELKAIIHWSTDNPPGQPNYEGTINVTWDVVWVVPFSIGGGNTTVTASRLGSSITVPSSLIRRRSSNPKKLLAPGTRQFRRSTTSTFRRKNLKPEVIARKRARTSYSNGISDPNFSFFTNQTITTPLRVNYPRQYDNSVTGSPDTGRPSLLGNEIDETVAGIINVNSSVSPLADYYYNAITPQKIKNSFSPEATQLLQGMYNLNGTPMADSVASFVKKSIISNEIGTISENDLRELRDEMVGTKAVFKSSNLSTNNRSALDLITNNLLSINPSDFGIKKRNRMIYWKPLAEDLDKRLIFKTADGTETNIYIPNNEKITVEYSASKSATLEMQDGDFFAVETLDGDDRLTVFSEIEQARIVAPDVASRAAYLAGDDFHFQLDATSVTSDLVEFNVDTTSTRQDYYFLALDKDSVADRNSNLQGGDTLFTRKTYAKYNYTTTGIDDIVKHKAYPNLILYLRDDDMFFNHLEASEEAHLIHKDITLDNFENSLEDQILIRRLPQHILIIPSDRTAKVISQERSQFIDFNTRRLKIRFSPAQDYKKLPKDKPPYLRPVFTQTESLNFGTDIQDNTIWNEKIKFVFDTTAVAAIDRYKNGAEVLPRKETSITKLLKTLNTIKDAYSLTERDKINTFDLFSRMEPSDIKSLKFDVDDGYSLLSRLATNTITEDTTVNKSKFVKARSIAALPASEIPVQTTFLPANEEAPQVSTQKQQTAKTAAPSDRSGGLGS
tara:strand:- start:3875 stop:8038 length:4164 start_codon:yes stop_codon:yes gene_type:complete